MFYADLRNKPEGPFKRLTGVRPSTSLEMCEALQMHLPSGRHPPNFASKISVCSPDGTQNFAFYYAWNPERAARLM